MKANLDGVLHHHDLGDWVSPTRATVREYAGVWLEDNVWVRLLESTYLEYKDTLDRHILPPLGDIRLYFLDSTAIEGAYAKLMRGEKTAGTVNHAHRVLKAMLNKAVRAGKPHRNLALAVDLPKKTEAKRAILSEAEAGAFLASVRGDDLEAQWNLLLTGFRIGEKLALQWDDVDFADGTVRIDQATAKAIEAPWKLNHPKTDSGRRVIPVDDITMALLKAHRTRQREGHLRLWPATTEARFRVRHQARGAVHRERHLPPVPEPAQEGEGDSGQAP